MTVKEMMNELAVLYRIGKGDLSVFFYQSKDMQYGIGTIREIEIIPGQKVISLEWGKKKNEL